MYFIPSLIRIACITVFISINGCGVLVGNIRPVTEKAEQYGILDLSQERPDLWTKIQNKSANEERTDSDTTPSEVSDVAFQALKSPSIIALNSGCRPSVQTQTKELKDLTNELLMGFTEVENRIEKNITLEQSPALETTIRGKMADKPIFLRTVVLRKNRCVYDLLFMSSPTDFTTHESDFSKFVASLRIK